MHKPRLSSVFETNDRSFPRLSDRAEVVKFFNAGRGKEMFYYSSSVFCCLVETTEICL